MQIGIEIREVGHFDHGVGIVERSSIPRWRRDETKFAQQPRGVSVCRGFQVVLAIRRDVGAFIGWLRIQ